MIPWLWLWAQLVEGKMRKKNTFTFPVGCENTPCSRMCEEQEEPRFNWGFAGAVIFGLIAWFLIVLLWRLS